MSKIRKLVFVLAMLVAINMFSTGVALAKPLDEIEDYTIRVSMRQDGTMNITYHIEWKVLDSVSEGPLEWVKIGVPNKHIDEIEATSPNISKIGYMNEGGSYVRIDLDRKYQEGEVVKLDFSIHQSYMYVIDDDAHLCRYSFTPGWFDAIDVKHIKIMWKNDNVIESSAQKDDDGYLIWEASLRAGERLNASVEYNLDVFDTNKDQQFQDDHTNASDVALPILCVGAIFVAVFFVLLFFEDDDYSDHSGFRGGGYHTHYHYHSSGYARRSCACASHCACACACAGGGRAGCTVKDFYKSRGSSQETSADEVQILLRVLRDESNQ